VSVVAIQRGTLDPDRIVMMAGDIDSRVSDPLNGTSDSPGANDNASGLAGTIEAARVLSQHRFAGSIAYVGLSGEEQGLFGGKILAERALANGWRIKAVLNNDMIGNISGIDGVTDRHRWCHRQQYCARVLGRHPLRRNGRGSCNPPQQRRRGGFTFA
jgi:hypothetical protein